MADEEYELKWEEMKDLSMLRNRLNEINKQRKSFERRDVRKSEINERQLWMLAGQVIQKTLKAKNYANIKEEGKDDSHIPYKPLKSLIAQIISQLLNEERALLHNMLPEDRKSKPDDEKDFIIACEIHDRNVKIFHAEKITKPRTYSDDEINQIIKDYLAYQDIDVPGKENTKEKRLALAMAQPNVRKYAIALIKLFRIYSEPKVTSAAQMAKGSCLGWISKLNIQHEIYTTSLTWAYWDIAKQYYFVLNPSEAERNYRVANPLKDGDKFKEIIDRMLGWDAYGKCNLNKEWEKWRIEIFSRLNDSHTTFARIKEFLEKKPDNANKDSLHSYELAELGKLIRENLKNEKPTPKYDLKAEIRKKYDKFKDLEKGTVIIISYSFDLTSKDHIYMRSIRNKRRGEYNIPDWTYEMRRSVDLYLYMEPIYLPGALDALLKLLVREDTPIALSEWLLSTEMNGIEYPIKDSDINLENLGDYTKLEKDKHVIRIKSLPAAVKLYEDALKSAGIPYTILRKVEPEPIVKPTPVTLTKFQILGVYQILSRNSSISKGFVMMSRISGISIESLKDTATSLAKLLNDKEKAKELLTYDSNGEYEDYISFVQEMVNSQRDTKSREALIKYAEVGGLTQEDIRQGLKLGLITERDAQYLEKANSAILAHKYDERTLNIRQVAPIVIYTVDNVRKVGRLLRKDDDVIQVLVKGENDIQRLSELKDVTILEAVDDEYRKFERALDNE